VESAPNTSLDTIASGGWLRSYGGGSNLRKSASQNGWTSGICVLAWCAVGKKMTKRGAAMARGWRDSPRDIDGCVGCWGEGGGRGRFFFG
jgi:hypothetical protein